ncbi:TagK domain-containing protein [[Erwinia] mediterraneensis]|uniref:TagK domain-containing protein n=1 Tax=[Erwinia] mediterraneensis TaxID=2161819 RepID=UPI0013EF235F|nr:TagK domain-containing protein [[Erwinia] mediterraneensis]
MNILLTWPEQQHAFFLAETCSADKPLRFDVVDGIFTLQETDTSESIHFYWCGIGPVIRNHCRDYVCIEEGIALANGECRLLRENSKIQAGNFSFITPGSDNTETEAALFDDILHQHGNIAEILPGSGYHSISAESLLIGEPEENGEDDILKKLEREYKTWLVTGEHATPVQESVVRQTQISFCDDKQFARMQEQMNARTLTECLFASPALIGKVLTELDETLAPEDFTPAEEPYDLLSMLAPENYVKGRKKSLSALAYQHLYQPGLDSQF